MSGRSKVTNSALSEGNAVEFIEIVNFRPNFVESNELYHNSFRLFDSADIGLSIVLYFMLFFLYQLYSFFLLYLLFTVSKVILVLFHALIDVFSVVKLLSSKIPFEERGFQSIPKLYLFVFDQRALLLCTNEVLEPVNCPIVFSPLFVIPLYSDPFLFSVRSICRLAFMLETSEISYSPNTVVEQNPPVLNFLGVFEIVALQLFGLCFKVVRLGLFLTIVLLESLSRIWYRGCFDFRGNAGVNLVVSCFSRQFAVDFHLEFKTVFADSNL